MTVCQVNSCRPRVPLVLTSILILAAGCSSGGSGAPTAPGIVSPPGGTGTNSLLVQASVQGRDVSPGVFETSFTATVYDTLNLPATGATVSVSGPSGGPVSLPEVVGTPGTYQQTVAGYQPGTYTLSVAWGSESISGARVTGPTIHTITSPVANTALTAGQPITVTWSRMGLAQSAKVESRDYQSLDEPDDMVSSIPASGNPVSADQRVRVKRSNQTTITAGLPGSTFEATMRNTVEPLTAQ